MLAEQIVEYCLEIVVGPRGDGAGSVLGPERLPLSASGVRRGVVQSGGPRPQFVERPGVVARPIVGRGAALFHDPRVRRRRRIDGPHPATPSEQVDVAVTNAVGVAVVRHIVVRQVHKSDGSPVGGPRRLRVPRAHEVDVTAVERRDEHSAPRSGDGEGQPVPGRRPGRVLGIAVARHRAVDRRSGIADSAVAQAPPGLGDRDVRDPTAVGRHDRPPLGGARVRQSALGSIRSVHPQTRGAPVTSNEDDPPVARHRGLPIRLGRAGDPTRLSTGAVGVERHLPNVERPRSVGGEYQRRIVRSPGRLAVPPASRCDAHPLAVRRHHPEITAHADRKAAVGGVRWIANGDDGWLLRGGGLHERDDRESGNEHLGRNS
jgi:hypothetical protein